MDDSGKKLPRLARNISTRQIISFCSCGTNLPTFAGLYYLLLFVYVTLCNFFLKISVFIPKSIAGLGFLNSEF